MTKKQFTNMWKMYTALKKISCYDSIEKLHRHAEKEYGCEPSEAIEMAYENIQLEAKAAIKGVRLPKG